MMRLRRRWARLAASRTGHRPRPALLPALVVCGALLAWLLALLLAASAPTATREERLRIRVTAFMAETGIAGGVLATGRAGDDPTLLVVGHADPQTHAPMTPGQHFRLASLSKPLTAAAITQLVATGRLRMEERLVDMFPELLAAPDTRHRAITVRHLLQHTAGWDDRHQPDAVGLPAHFYRRADADRIDHCGGIARDALARPLVFAPGTRQAYSNLAYCWLGQVVELRSGMPYAEYVRHAVLAPAGLREFRIAAEDVPASLRATSWQRQADGAWQALGEGASTPATLRRFAPFGGWTATATDYFRFAGLPLPATVGARPAGAVPTQGYYGLGWRVWPQADGIVLTHTGILAGTFTFVVRMPDGQVVVGLFNGGSAGQAARLHTLVDDVRTLLGRTAGAAGD